MDARDVHWREDIVRRAIADLPRIVASPTLDAPSLLGSARGSSLGLQARLRSSASCSSRGARELSKEAPERRCPRSISALAALFHRRPCLSRRRQRRRIPSPRQCRSGMPRRWVPAEAHRPDHRGRSPRRRVRRSRPRRRRRGPRRLRQRRRRAPFLLLLLRRRGLRCRLLLLLRRRGLRCRLHPRPRPCRRRLVSTPRSASPLVRHGRATALPLRTSRRSAEPKAALRRPREGLERHEHQTGSYGVKVE